MRAFPSPWFSLGGVEAGGIRVSHNREDNLGYTTSMASERPRANTTTTAYLVEAGSGEAAG